MPYELIDAGFGGMSGVMVEAGDEGVTIGYLLIEVVGAEIVIWDSSDPIGPPLLELPREKS